MNKNPAVFLKLIIFMIVLSMSACNLPGVTTSEGRIETSVAETLQSLKTLQRSAPSATLPISTEIPTATQETSTPTETATITQTATRSVTTVSVTVDTNCRSGPGVIYPYLGGLLVGEEAEIVGKVRGETHYLIKNPDAPGNCWISALYAQVQGSTANVPLLTPPPTPTSSPTVTATPQPKADVAFVNVHDCGGDPFATFSVGNTGNVGLEYMAIDLEDLNTNMVYKASGNSPFLSTANSCPPGDSDMGPGSVYYIGVGNVNALPGVNMEAVVRLCTQDNGEGKCIERVVNFIMPAP